MEKLQKEKIDKFFTAHNFRSDEKFQREVYKSILEDAKKGFEGKPSSVQMINTYCAYPRPIISKNILSIDIGGTNVRKAYISYDENSNPTILNITKMKTDVLLKSDNFFSTLAEFIHPIDKNVDKITLCFSYPFISFRDGDASLSGYAKGLKIETFKNKKIMRALKEELVKLSDNKNYNGIIINDSTAVLLYLSLKDKSEDSIKVAAIVGTGCNSAVYALKDDKVTAICTEAGHADLKNVELSDFDKRVDETSLCPGSSVFETLTSGFYLYRLVKEVLTAALLENIFDREEVDFVKQYIAELKDTSYIDRGFLKEAGFNMNYILERVRERSALVVASLLQASIDFAFEYGKTKSKNVSILIDGSTYNFLPLYKERTESLTKKILKDYNVNFFYGEDNEVLLGASAANI